MPELLPGGAVLVQLHEHIIIADSVEIDVAGAYIVRPLITNPSAISTSSIVPTHPLLNTGFILTGEVWVIGRDRSCDVQVARRRTDISRKHATIRREGAIYTLFDHSRHGTFVNNTPIYGPCRLDTDDIIGFASTREMLRFINYDQITPFVQLLSEREQEVLCNLASGLSVKQIADELTISQNTVQTHLKHLYEKLGVNSREEAVTKARKLQLLRKL